MPRFFLTLFCLLLAAASSDADDLVTIQPQRFLFPGDDAEGAYDMESILATDNNGTWLASWWRFYGYGPNTTNAAMFRTTDMGETWTSLGTPFTVKPKVMHAANGVWLCVCETFTPSVLEVWRSDDAGANWTRVAEGTNPISSNYKPALLESGGTWALLYTEGLNGGIARCMRSTDNGLTWSDPAAIHPAGSPETTYKWTYNAVESEGTFIAIVGGEPAQCLRSADAGLTWSSPTTLPIEHHVSQVVRAGADGEVLLVGGNYAWTDIQWTFSDDFGETWTEAEDANVEQFLLYNLNLFATGPGIWTATSYYGLAANYVEFSSETLEWSEAEQFFPEDLGGGETIECTESGDCLMSFTATDTSDEASDDSDIFAARRLLGEAWESLDRIDPESTGESRDDYGPAIAADHNGALLLGWNSYDKMGWSVSLDDGQTWSERQSRSGVYVGRKLHHAGAGLWATAHVSSAGPRLNTFDSTTLNWTTKPAFSINENVTAQGAALAVHPDGYWLVASARSFLGEQRIGLNEFRLFGQVDMREYSLPSNSGVTNTKVDIASDGQDHWMVVWLANNVIVSKSGVSDGTDATWQTTWGDRVTIRNSGAGTSSPSLATNGSAWVTVWMRCNSGECSLYSSTTMDNGATWSTAVPVSDECDEDSVQLLKSDGGDTWALVWNFDGDILLSISQDTGATWSAPYSLSTSGVATGANLDYNRNKQWTAVWSAVLEPLTVKHDSDIFLAEFTVTPLNHKPELTLVGPPSIVLECGDSYEEFGAAATDDNDPAISEKIVIQSNVDSGAVGEYTVTYTVADADGLAADPIQRQVHVADTTPPQIQLTGDAPYRVECGGSYVEPGAAASDNCDGVLQFTAHHAEFVDSATPGAYLVTYTAQDLAAHAGQATRWVVVEGCEGESEQWESVAFHNLDAEADLVLSITELLRAVQFYNAGAYACAEGTEDGFAPGSGNQACRPLQADYRSFDWKLDLSELLRVIQLYAAGAYHACLDSEDGFCPGTLAP